MIHIHLPVLQAAFIVDAVVQAENGDFAFLHAWSNVVRLIDNLPT
jgi:hypothetical protein